MSNTTGDILLNSIDLNGNASNPGGTSTIWKRSSDNEIFVGNTSIIGTGISDYAGLYLENGTNPTTFLGSSTDFSQKTRLQNYTAGTIQNGVGLSSTQGTFTINDPGVYYIFISLSFTTAVNNQVISGAFFISNGAVKRPGRVTRKTGTAGDVGAASFGIITNFVSSTDIAFYLQNETSTASVTVNDASFMAIKFSA